MALPPAAPDIRVGDLVSWITSLTHTASVGVVLKVIRCQQDLDGTSMESVKIQFDPNKPCYFIFSPGGDGFHFLAGVPVALISGID